MSSDTKMTSGNEGDNLRAERRAVTVSEGEAKTVTQPVPQHGRDNTYKNGCRCEECREAHRLAERTRRAKRRATGDVTHGSVAGYDIGCRCDQCADAKSKASRVHYQTRTGCPIGWCPVCGEGVGLYRDGTLVRHGRPLCEGSKLDPDPTPTVPDSTPPPILIGYWRDYAACLGMDTSMFYPENGKTPVAARQVCKRCPVAAECLNDALLTNDKHGVRGGLTEKDRRKLRKAS